MHLLPVTTNRTHCSSTATPPPVVTSPFSLPSSPYPLLCRFGEVVDCNLVRDKDSGKSRGFAVLAYEDQRSCVLAIDNLNGAKVVNRTLRVDHADKYRRPKEIAPAPAQDAEFLQFDAEPSAAYDQRRKAIWDYEAYAPSSVAAPADARAKVRDANASSAPTSYSVDVKALKVADNSEDRNAVRILRLWEERQARKRQREEEEQRQLQQQHKGRGGNDRQQKFGDQTLQSTAVKEQKEDRRIEERKETTPAMKREESDVSDRGKRDSDADRGRRERRRDSGDDREKEDERDRRRRRRDDSRERSPRGSPRRDDTSSRRHRDRDRGRDRDRDRSPHRARHR
jgi:RNA-binding motif X-linked protein 2